MYCAAMMFRVTYGWIGQPHRDRYKLFGSLADAQVFESRWLSGGRERTARVKRVAP